MTLFLEARQPTGAARLVIGRAVFSCSSIAVVDRPARLAEDIDDRGVGRGRRQPLGNRWRRAFTGPAARPLLFLNLAHIGSGLFSGFSFPLSIQPPQQIAYAKYQQQRDAQPEKEHAKYGEDVSEGVHFRYRV